MARPTAEARLDALVADLRGLADEWACRDDTCDGDCMGCSYATELRKALFGMMKYCVWCGAVAVGTALGGLYDGCGRLIGRIGGRCPSCGAASHGISFAAFPSAHDCSTCADCVHEGRRCCGCYDGACCQREPWSGRLQQPGAILDKHAGEPAQGGEGRG